MGRLTFSTNSYREMAAAWKYPNVALEIRQELDIDMILLRRHVIAKSIHSIGCGPLRSDVTERVARASGDNAKIGLQRTVLGLQQPTLPGPFDLPYARLLHLLAG